jgi:hypothetical protein
MKLYICTECGDQEPCILTVGSDCAPPKNCPYDSKPEWQRITEIKDWDGK